MACTWSNKTYQFIADRLGEENCERMREREYPPIPDPGVFSHLGLYLRTKALNSIVFLKGYRGGRRVTHQLGVGGLGIARIVDNPEMPSNGFFIPERVFLVRIRHANLTNDDDRSLDVRSASLKFSDEDMNSPLDLIMNTGDRCPFWNGPSVTDYQASRKSERDMEEWCFKNSAYYFNAIQGVRRGPSSYSHLKFYSQMTFEMNDDNLVRFRLIPHDYNQQESGLPDDEDQQTPWDYQALDDDDREPNYLKTEYKRRLSETPITYRLQIQIHSGLTKDLELYNMGKVWDEIKCPWNDLAEITIFRYLEDHIIERTCYNVSHLPECLVLPESPSYQDYRSIGHLRREVYTASQRGRFQSMPKLTYEQVTVRYALSIQTASTKRAGYNGTAYVTITGSLGRTDALKLDKSRLFGDNFVDGESTLFHFEAPDVGDLQYLRFDLDDPIDGWYIEMVIVEKEGQIRPFPAYQWVYSQVIIRTGEATLPFQDNAELQALRALETQKWRDQLPWYKWESMPSHAAISEHSELPRDVQFMDEKYRDFYAGRDEGIRNFMLNKFMGLFKDIESLESFTKFFKYKVGGCCVPAVAERWMSDREFGRQFLQGAHPTAFRQLTELPANFPVKNEDVQGVLGRKVTLKQEIKAGRIYIVDYKMLEGIDCATGVHVTPAMALFYVNASGMFLPMAIQLFQEPGTANPIWTPSDTDTDWLCAKLFLKCADAQLHQMQNHLLKTHLVMEPVAICLYRNVSRVHPVFKLLIPHVRYTIAINTIGRRGLIGENGLADKVLAIGKGGHICFIMKSYRNFDFNSLKLPLALSQRGVMNHTTLPGYHYRDDALQLWIAIRSFVGDIINIYYQSDDDVKNDEEIQDWVGELHDIGLPQHGLEGEVDHHIPQYIHSMADLIEFVTTIIFTCSCEHAAQNFGQFEYYAFYPNYPMLMRELPPKEKGKTTMNYLLKALGHTDHVCVQLATVWLLSTFSEDELFLGDYPNRHFHEHQALSAIHRFQEHLRNIEASIDERNSSLEVPYEYLKPSRIPNSVAV